MASEATKAAIAVARATRKNGKGSPVEQDARRHLTTAKIAEYVERELAKAPPLNDDQKARLAGLFGGGK